MNVFPIVCTYLKQTMVLANRRERQSYKHSLPAKTGGSRKELRGCLPVDGFGLLEIMCPGTHQYLRDLNIHKWFNSDWCVEGLVLIRYIQGKLKSSLLSCNLPRYDGSWS